MANNVLIFKIVTLSLILVSTFIATLLPTVLRLTSGFKRKGKSNPIIRGIEWILHISQGFAAGVLLSAGIVHLLEENAEELSDAIHELDIPEQWKDFPFGHAAAVMAFAAFYLFETTTTGLLSFLIERKHSKKDSNDHSHDDVIVEDGDLINGTRMKGSEHAALLKGSNTATYYSIEKSVNVSESDSEDSVKWAHKKDSHEHHHTHGLDFDVLEKQSFARAAISCFVLWLSLFSHSFIEGLSMGLQTELNNFVALLIAIMFHKLFAAYSLGVVVANAAFKARSCITVLISIVFIISFSVATPVGIGVGIGFSDTSFADELWFKITSSALLCAASGVFIFISIFELLFENAEKHHEYGNKLLTSFFFNVLFATGIAGMIAVAYWA